MVDGANVTSIDAIRRFRGRLIEFTEEAQVAMSQAEFDIQRTIGWLKHDRLAHWKHQIKRCRKAVDNAKSELFRKQLESKDTRTSAIEERKNLQRAQAKLEEAEQKHRAVQKWIRRLDRDIALYKGATSQMNSLLSADMPKATALLEAYADRLDEYVQMRAPSIAPRGLSVTSEADSEDSDQSGGQSDPAQGGDA